MIGIDTENKLFEKGHRTVAGIDEAGRGPLAGPVVVGLVLLEKNSNWDPGIKEIQTIKDSKLLSNKKREDLFDFIKKNFPVAIGICDNQTIDRLNIRQAVFLAMKKALGQLKEKPDFLLLDGIDELSNCSYKQQSIKNGDRLVFSIAAASIVAKVSRDKIMEKLHGQYPDYGLDRHKGYGTKLHLENIKKFGPCPVHRKTFKPISEYFSK